MSAELELKKSVHDMRLKYAYFLLAAVGACIGFAVTQTRGEMISIYQIPLAIAVISWSASFYVGCRYVHLLSVMVIFDINAMRSLRGSESERIAIQSYHNADTDAASAYRWQLRSFLIGAAFFLIWHVGAMWNASPKLFWALNP